jgi:hypothetical protein
MNLRNLFNQSFIKKDEEYAKLEEEKKGCLRGGNTGYIANGIIKGKDPRKAILRYFGVPEPTEDSRRTMFKSGELMEDLLMGFIKPALSSNQSILTQEECATKWETNGIPVTGRPDIVIADNNKPTFVIESKMAASYWSVRNTFPIEDFKYKPAAAHVAQAAHYMFALGQQS